MKTGCSFLLTLFLLGAFYFFLTDTPDVEIEQNPSISPTPDLDREIHSFDWHEYKYKYKDEVIGEPGRYQDPLPPDYYFPDFSVEIHPRSKPPTTTTPQDTYEVINGVRYRVRIKPNGDKQLIPAR